MERRVTLIAIKVYDLRTILKKNILFYKIKGKSDYKKKREKRENKRRKEKAFRSCNGLTVWVCNWPSSGSLICMFCFVDEASQYI